MGNELSNVQPHGRDFENLLFEHVPISRHNRHIRILHLPKQEARHHLVRDMTQTLDVELISGFQDYHCTMEVVSLDDKPEFKALSYTWGSPKPTCKIMVNNQPFWITSNLASAFHHLTGTASVTLWVDAVCINQKDNTEKSWQIEQMVQVYQQAESTLVWLGERTMENLSGFETLRKLNRLWDMNNNFEETQETLALRNLQKEVFFLTGPLTTSRYQNGELIDSILALLSAEWWGRIWVMQELTVSQSVQFVCGYDTLDSDHLSNFLDKWDQLCGKSRMLDHRPWAHFEVRSRYRSKNPLTIKDILQISSKAQLQATVPKDQVIGFSALAGSNVDYSQDYITVFTDLARTLVTECPDLWILSFCVYSSSSPLPSWVPDWSRQPGLATILQAAGAYKIGARSTFRASRYLEPSISFLDSEPLVLRCQGIPVDVISRIGTQRPIIRFNDVNDDTRNEILDWFRDEFSALLAHVSSDEQSDVYTAQERSEAPFRTLILNRWENNFGWEQAYPWVKRLYDKLVNPSNTVADQRRLTTPGAPTEQFFNYAFRNTISRVPFVTKKRYLGMSSPHAEVGDVVVVLGGGDVPYVLRAVGSGEGEKRYRLVGEAYVHGMMEGQAVTAKYEVDVFEIA